MINTICCLSVWLFIDNIFTKNKSLDNRGTFTFDANIDSDKNRYAGTIDLIGVMNKNIILVDYKSSYRKKTQEEIDEYFLQLAAYTLAHDWQYKTKIDSIMIFLCMRNGDHEENTVSLDELKKYQIKWLERLNSFEDKNSNE